MILIILFAAREPSPSTNGVEGANDSPCNNTANNEKSGVEIEWGMDVDNVKDSHILAAAVTSLKAEVNEKSAKIDQEMAAAVTSLKANDHEKSAEIEQEMDIKNSTTVGIATSLEVIDTSLPRWLSKILPYLCNVSDFKDW